MQRLFLGELSANPPCVYRRSVLRTVPIFEARGCLAGRSVSERGPTVNVPPTGNRRATEAPSCHLAPWGTMHNSIDNKPLRRQGDSCFPYSEPGGGSATVPLHFRHADAPEALVGASIAKQANVLVRNCPKAAASAPHPPGHSTVPALLLLRIGPPEEGDCLLLGVANREDPVESSQIENLSHSRADAEEDELSSSRSGPLHHCDQGA